MFAFRSPELPISLSSRQSSPLVFAETHDNRAVHAASGSGGGRSSAISRRMSAKSCLEMATSAMRTARDSTLSAPLLLLPSIQVNMRAGKLPPAESDGVHYLKVPVKLV